MNIFLLFCLTAFNLGNNQVEIKNDDYSAQVKFYNTSGMIISQIVIDNIYGYKIAPEGKFLYILNKDGINVYNSEGRLVKRINDKGILAVSPKDEYLVCVSDNIVRVYNFCRARLQPCEEQSKRKGLFYITWSLEVSSPAIRHLIFSSNIQYLGVTARNNFSFISLENKQIVWTRDFPEPLIFSKITDDKIILVTENHSQLKEKVFLFSLAGEMLQEYNFRYQQYDEQIQNIEIFSEVIKAKTHLREWTLGDFEIPKDQTSEANIRFEIASHSLAMTTENGDFYDTIPWPLGPTDSLHCIGNNWGEFQDYGGAAYFHPGVDILSPTQPGVPVYAVKRGYVKTWLSTGDLLYWRLGIADSSLSYTDSCNGYLYAHIDSARFHKDVGDTVSAGELIGYLVYWPVDSIGFHHCHFAKIRDRGSTWTVADWAFIFNPLISLMPNQDTVPPTFENTLSNQNFAFAHNNTSTYLSPNSLNGNVDIIAKIYDRFSVSTGDTVWDRLIPLKIEYEIRGQDSSVPRKLSFDFSGQVLTSTSLVSVVYKQDNTCQSQGDYSNRDYYFIVTNTDGDNIIESSDAAISWRTTQFPNGNYWIKVYAYDVSNNVSVCSMQVTVNNGGGVTEEENHSQFSKSVCEGGLFNSLGQKLSNLNLAQLKPGIYFYRQNYHVHKLLIVKPNKYFISP